MAGILPTPTGIHEGVVLLAAERARVGHGFSEYRKGPGEAFSVVLATFAANEHLRVSGLVDFLGTKQRVTCDDSWRKHGRDQTRFESRNQKLQDVWISED